MRLGCVSSTTLSASDYGIPTRQTTDAIKTLAATEGIITDPVYSGKALWADCYR